MKKIILVLLFVFSAGMIQADVIANTVTPSLRAMCTLSPASDSRVKGWVQFTQKNGYVVVEGEISGLTPGKHEFHVHEKGDCSVLDASSAGGDFNPTHMEHGDPASPMRHLGDLGNIRADKSGNAKFKFHEKIIQLTGDESILNKSLILHADPDDMKTQPSGNAGKRVACGVIEQMH